MKSPQQTLPLRTAEASLPLVSMEAAFQGSSLPTVLGGGVVWKAMAMVPQPLLCPAHVSYARHELSSSSQ